MEYRKIGDNYYVRMDRGDEITGKLLDVCRAEGIGSAVFSGIGGCSEVDMQIFMPEISGFRSQIIKGTLELVSINGNIISDDEGRLYHHTHGFYAYFENGEHKMAAGHLKSTIVLYTAEIELRPVIGGVIKRKYDPETGTGFWRFCDE